MGGCARRYMLHCIAAPSPGRVPLSSSHERPTWPKVVQDPGLRSLLRVFKHGVEADAHAPASQAWRVTAMLGWLAGRLAGKPAGWPADWLAMRTHARLLPRCGAGRGKLRCAGGRTHIGKTCVLYAWGRVAHPAKMPARAHCTGPFNKLGQYAVNTQARDNDLRPAHPSDALNSTASGSTCDSFRQSAPKAVGIQICGGNACSTRPGPAGLTPVSAQPRE